jgi:hypothetical protein
MKTLLHFFFAATVLGILFKPASVSGNTNTNTVAAASENKPWDPIYIDPEDGMLDLSEFVANAHGFIPVVVPITQPAVGYGALGALVFMSRPEKEPGQKAARPNITAVGGLATENGTWGVFGANIQHWMDDRFETVVAPAYMDVNLNYYPPDSNGSGNSIEYNMKMPALYLRGRYRFKESQWSTSLGLIAFQNTLSFPGTQLPPGLNQNEIKTTQVALSPAVTYDTRDNIFTPTKGLVTQLQVQLFNQALGGDADYQLPQFFTYFYQPVSEKLFFGLNVSARTAHGDVPFYQLPYIQLRGLPAMRYQGDQVGEVAAQLRWQFHGRYSVLGFGGYGASRLDERIRTVTQTAGTYGVGMRYEIAKAYGLHMGFDIARGPEDTILYIQFGSAWQAP